MSTASLVFIFMCEKASHSVVFVAYFCECEILSVFYMMLL